MHKHNISKMRTQAVSISAHFIHFHEFILLLKWLLIFHHRCSSVTKVPIVILSEHKEGLNDTVYTLTHSKVGCCCCSLQNQCRWSFHSSIYLRCHAMQRLIEAARNTVYLCYERATKEHYTATCINLSSTWQRVKLPPDTLTKPSPLCFWEIIVGWDLIPDHGLQGVSKQLTRS